MTAISLFLSLALPITAQESAGPDSGLKSGGGRWRAQGPGPLQFGQVENVVPDDEVVGAVHTVVAHPTDPDTLYAGTVNGGVWKTTNATALRPSWEPLTDGEASLSIGALELDPTDTRHRTLVAGIGLYSAFGGTGGARTGLLRTTNGGRSWKEIDGGGLLVGKNVAGVAPRGHTITVAVDIADLFTFGNIGIFRSTDGGDTFTALSGAAGSGLPPGAATDLVGDPNNPSRLYTAIVFASLLALPDGIYRSDDGGATWLKVSDAQIDAQLAPIVNTNSNVEIAVGRSDNVYVAVANNGRLTGLFRSGDAGGAWTALDLPGTVEEGVFIGIHPGGQASIHLSIAADPTEANVVYLGGDRQPFAGEGSGSPSFFPNSIGAVNFSGRLFRVDASQPPGSQSAHLTHSSVLGAPGGGTASDSSPHADSREMVFDAAGNLIETDDGGIYRRTNPRSNTGDWFSANGDLQSNEQHDTAFDTNSDIAFSGNQDNGTSIQNLPDDLAWSLLLTGDGGDVAVVDDDPSGISTRFSSAQFLQAFNRTLWDGANNFVGFSFPALQVVGGGASLVPQFTTPVAVNAVDGNRLVIGGANSVYESFDQGSTLVEVGPGLPVVGGGRQPIAYGAPGNADVLYVGIVDSIFVRTAPPPAPLVLSTAFPGTGSGFSIRGIVIDPDDFNTAYVANSIGVFQTRDAGASWTEITGDLPDRGAVPPLRSLAYVPRTDDDDEHGHHGHGDTGKDLLLVGTTDGAYFAKENQDFAKWKTFGRGLPTVPVFELDYDGTDNVAVAGTLGRGAWKLSLSGFDDD